LPKEKPDGSTHGRAMRRKTMKVKKQPRNVGQRAIAKILCTNGDASYLALKRDKRRVQGSNNSPPATPERGGLRSSADDRCSRTEAGYRGVGKNFVTTACGAKRGGGWVRQPV